MIGRSWVTRKVVCVHVVAVFQIVHELWVVSHESFTCFTTSAFTLYTYYIELSTGGHTFFLFLRFKCPYHLSFPCLSTSATLTRLGKRQFVIFEQLEYNYNTIFVYSPGVANLFSVACQYSDIWMHKIFGVPRQKNKERTLTRLCKRQFKIFGQLEYNYNTIFVYTIQYNTIFGQFGMQQPDACTWAGLNNSTILKPSKWRHCDPEHCKKKMKLSKRAKSEGANKLQRFRSDCNTAPDACTWAELKFKLCRGITRNSRVEFHSNLRGRYPPWTSKGSPTFVKNLRNVI